MLPNRKAKIEADIKLQALAKSSRKTISEESSNRRNEEKTQESTVNSLKTDAEKSPDKKTEANLEEENNAQIFIKNSREIDSGRIPEKEHGEEGNDDGRISEEKEIENISTLLTNSSINTSRGDNFSDFKGLDINESDFFDDHEKENPFENLTNRKTSISSDDSQPIINLTNISDEYVAIEDNGNLIEPREEKNKNMAQSFKNIIKILPTFSTKIFQDLSLQLNMP